MTIIVDTNIAFSAILNTKSIIGDLIINSNNIFQFQSCHFLWQEIDKHWSKLKKISRLEESDLLESQRIVYKNISFIDEGQIPKLYRLQAYELVKAIDLNDLVFVALREYQKAILWTGDKALISGLKSSGYNRVITTDEMINLRKRLEANG
ncbi:MAG: PIN domain-containing protein [Salinivirgaceae bacterium]|jgi:predicted nucleic acid-binding protein